MCLSERRSYLFPTNNFDIEPWTGFRRIRAFLSEKRTIDEVWDHISVLKLK